jgi:peptidoglycan/xylan/chitin deacetylase (PgdA/CDA1 family)
MLPKSGDFFAVMYHYVRPKEQTKLRYLEIDVFKKQLDLFEQRYGIVTKADWEKFRSTGKYPTGVLLTFDDGLKDHFKYVLPILLERNLFGIFYVCTNPLKGSALPVHLTHYLLANKDAESIWAALNSMGLKKDLSTTLDSKSYFAYAEHDHTNLEKNLKRIINWATVDIGQTKLLLDAFIDLTDTTQNQFVRDWYLNEQEISQMIKLGYEIGSHTCSHKLLSNLMDYEINYELNDSKNILNEIFDINVRSFCFPFGGEHSYNANILNKLAKFGYSESFSVNPVPIKSLYENVHRNMELPRYDCNNFIK